MISYNPLWKKLIDKNMTKKELMNETKVSKSTIIKMKHNEFISLEVINRLCAFFSCQPNEIIEYKEDDLIND